MILLATALCYAAEPVELNVADFGAKGDGITLNTVLIQKAINECTMRGGGIVRVPEGIYLTGTIQLKDNVTLRIEDKAVLQGSHDPADYRNLDPFSDGSGNKMGYVLLVAKDARNVGIGGRGTIDGKGKLLKAAEKKFNVRPFLLRWIRCQNVSIRDVHLVNPDAWTLNFFQSGHIVVQGITILTAAGFL